MIRITKHYTFLALVGGIVLLNACASSATTPTLIAPTQASPALAATAEPTTAAITRVERRAPTLAPTATETAVPSASPLPTETATVENSATPLPLPTRTRANVVPTATPPLEKAVYVTKLQIEPPAPKSKPSEFFFTVNFLNTVGENVNYPRWRVLIFPGGQTKPIGDPQGESKTIVNGASQQNTERWAINVGTACEPFTAQTVWEDENGKQNPLFQTDGKPVTIEFQVCP